jgi:iron complex transport system substrate-binding protein
MKVKMPRRTFHILFFAVLVLSVACGGSSEEPGETAQGAAVEAPYPARIISMAPSITEIVFALGLGDRVVGVSDFCDYPPEARDRTKIGGVVNPNMEAIIALSPDLVLALPNATHESLFRSLRLLGINVITVRNDSLQDLFTTLDKIGEETSKQSEAAEMSEALRAKFSEVSAKIAGRSRRKVMFIVGVDPLFVAGSGTFIDELIEMAGGENIVADSLSKYPRLGSEEVVSRAPDVILYTSLNFELTPEQEVMAKKLWSGYPSIPAVKNDRIIGLVADYVTLPGPRLGIGLEEMAHAIHPEAFDKPGKGVRN